MPKLLEQAVPFLEIHALPLFALSVCFLLESLFGRKGERSLDYLRRPSRSTRWDLLSGFLYFTGLKSILEAAVFIGGLAAVGQLTKNLELDVFGGWPLALQFVAGIIIHDFIYYWSHRFNHSTELTWVTHKYHHSATELNVFSDFRNHSTQRIFTLLTKTIPVQILFGLSVRDALLFSVASELIAKVSHSRWDTSFGWLGKYVLVSPRFHYLHHGLGPTGHKNYGEVFVIWDRLFGTYVEPNQSIYEIRTGIEDNYFIEDNMVKGFLKPIYEMYRELLSLPLRFWGRRLIPQKIERKGSIQP